MATSCHDLKLGQVLVCKECGLELQVVKECKECGQPADDCDCSEHCAFECCGKPLEVKASA